MHTCAWFVIPRLTDFISFLVTCLLFLQSIGSHFVRSPNWCCTTLIELWHHIECHCHLHTKLDAIIYGSGNLKWNVIIEEADYIWFSLLHLWRCWTFPVHWLVLTETQAPQFNDASWQPAVPVCYKLACQFDRCLESSFHVGEMSVTTATR